MAYTKHSKCITSTRKPKNVKDFAVILVGSKPEYRMKSYGPQHLFRVNGKTLLEHQVETIRKVSPDAEIIVVIGFETDRILRQIPQHVRIIENCRYETTNECEDLRLAINATLSSKVIIINSRLLFNPELLNQIPNQSCFVVDSSGQIGCGEIGITVVNSRPTIFSYDIDKCKWAHTTFLSENDLELLKDICKDRRNSQRLLFEIYNEILDKKHNITAIEPRNMDITLLNTSKMLKKTI